ncbi:kinase-like domain-containing protein [Lipomyces doorenjongii]|uniref:kinase-like domain-containing protein n=1 Tax=Lipomyces doorenjongii TaxID=383834 RepID=UPI0034CDFE66
MVTSSSTHLRLTDRFELLEPLGNGSFGTVSRARVRASGLSSLSPATPKLTPNAIVAIKSMKKSFANPADYLRLREVLFLRSLPPHDSLVRAHEIFLDLSTRQLHIVMECHQMNLYQYLHARSGVRFDTRVVRGMLKQILTGLNHIHSHGYFHRDIKPENILVTASPASLIPTVKLSDFGLVRDIHSTAPYTTYVSTRWYRAPEILLKTGRYGPEVDIWAFGAMAIEIMMLRPLFPGQNEWDQVWKVSEIMGTPERAGARGGLWDDADAWAERQGFMMPTGKLGTDLHHIMTANLDNIPAADEFNMIALAEFATACLQWNANKRPTVAQALNHRYFSGKLPAVREQVDAYESARSKVSYSWSSTDELSSSATASNSCSSAGTASSGSSKASSSLDSRDTIEYKVKPQHHQYLGSKYRIRTAKHLFSKSRDQKSLAPASASATMTAKKSGMLASPFKSRQVRSESPEPLQHPSARQFGKPRLDHFIHMADDTLDLDDPLPIEVSDHSPERRK